MYYRFELKFNKLKNKYDNLQSVEIYWIPIN